MAPLARSAPNTTITSLSGTNLSATTSAPSPSQRVTRSSTRLAESPSSKPIAKRKIPAQSDNTPPRDVYDQSPSLVAAKSGAKRRKITNDTSVETAVVASGAQAIQPRSSPSEIAMSDNGPPSKSEGTSKSHRGATKGPAGRHTRSTTRDTSPSHENVPRRQKKRGVRKDVDTAMAEAPTNEKTSQKDQRVTTPPPQPSTEDQEMPSNAGREEDQDPFAMALFGRGAPSGLSTTLRALSGMMSGMTSRLRDILTNLRQVDNSTMQLIALEEFSNLLLVSNEDNLSGSFSPDSYVKELITLMQPNPITGEENPEIMLLACRCIANLMEALRGSVANVVYGGAVPVLCQKLLDIQYIDVAEQALSTLSKVSIDFPASIVREGGLTACLQFLDFFATGTQRTAVMTAANCCRNIPHDCFPVIRDVMPILQNVLVSHDQKVVEQGCLCVTRIIDSFKHSPEKLEKLVDPPLLRAILSLLLPGTTNLIGANIHTEFLRVLAIVARASPKLSAELLKMNVVDILFQILTGVSPLNENADAASKIDSVIIMQALIHRPREQIYEALNVICELLPPARHSRDNEASSEEDFGSFSEGSQSPGAKARTRERIKLLKTSRPETRRFAMVLLPTLTDAYSSTVNLSVRQKVLTAQLRILSNLETEVIEEALRPVPYASFLASILSQEDHPSLVKFALQASELLFERLENIYQYQFYREGVVGEIKKLAERPLDNEVGFASKGSPQASKATAPSQHQNDFREQNAGGNGFKNDHTDDDDDDEHDEENDEDEDEDADEDEDEDEDEGAEGDVGEDDEHDDEDDNIEEDDVIIRDDADIAESQSSDSSGDDVVSPVMVAGTKDLVVIRARKILKTFDSDRSHQMKLSADKIRDNLRRLADEILAYYVSDPSGKQGRELFTKLAEYFHGDALESITSSELLESGIISLLVKILTKHGSTRGNPRGDFLAAFMDSVSSDKTKGAGSTPTSSALSVLVQKLQDLLSRAEHFEVLTVNNSAAENSRSSSTSMLSRQIRLKLNANADGDIPPTYRDMIVSIHAIATFKALDDYLRPRMSLSERPSSGSRRRDMLQQLANARMAQLSGVADSGVFSPFGTELGVLSQSNTDDSKSNSLASSRSKRSSPHEKLETGEERETIEKQQLDKRKQSSAFDGPNISNSEPLADSHAAKLECADEKSLEHDHQSGDLDDETLNAIVGELTQESDEEEEPSPVSMEVASSGKITARQQDGTRIYTPQQPGTPVQSATRATTLANAPTPGTPSARDVSGQGRPTSYAAAVAATPQDWHIQFSVDGKVIPQDTTIYRAVQQNRENSGDPVSRSIWSAIHPVTFRKVKGPPPSAESIARASSDQDSKREDLPASLDGHPITSAILSLLGILHDLNATLDDVREALVHAGIRLYAEPLASFINTKLTAKMNRQLEEPLIVASNCLPNWSEDLARTFPFLFPFETRHLFLQSTSFGYSRSITRWQNGQDQNDDRRDRRRDDRPSMGRPQRQKVRISRSRILESAMKVMEMYGASPSVLEVEYFDEVGTGLGPTLEFYSTVSKEFSKKKLKMWRENDSYAKDHYAFGRNGLFPAPMGQQEHSTEAGRKLLHFFRMLGKFIARSMLDSRIIDINFNPLFFKIGSNFSATPSIAALRAVDQDLANSLAQLQQFANLKANFETNTSLDSEQRAAGISGLSIKGARVEDLALDFTLPGYSNIDLVDKGSDIAVTMDNVGHYVERVLDMTLGSGIKSQIEAFETGFSQVFSYTSLRAFTPDELVMLFGRVEEDWTIETLMDSVKADHGFNMDSKSVKNLLHVMSELTKQQRRDFLQFVTGSPKLPIGGFKSLTPMFTVVCKPSEPPYSSDDYLPSVMTCVNYLKLPDYSTQEVMKQKLAVATKEGQGAFHLS